MEAAFLKTVQDLDISTQLSFVNLNLLLSLVFMCYHY